MQKDNFSSQDAADKVDDLITQLDDFRVSGLNSLSQFQQTRLKILKLERDRLSQKNSDDPRIVGLDEQLSYGDKLSSAINLEIAKSSVKTTTLPTDAWRTQGYVYYEDNIPANNITVFFVDGDSQWIQDFGKACTDSTGFYSLTVDGKFIADTSERQFYLSVEDKKKELSYEDTKPSVPVKGLIDTKNIYIESTNCSTPTKKSNRP